MSEKYESAADLAAKVDYEGSVADAIIGYGIKTEDLPDETPPDVRAAWDRVAGITDDVNYIIEWLDDVQSAADGDERE
jgi:hypothetical protein